MYPFEINGITLIKMNKKWQIPGAKFILSDDADEKTLEDLVLDMPAEYEVMFFDKNYTSPSEPGAYVMFRKINNRYVVKRGNHGWSSEWFFISPEKLTDYLNKCSNSHKRNNSGYAEEMRVLYQTSPIPLEKIMDSEVNL